MVLWLWVNFRVTSVVASTVIFLRERLDSDIWVNYAVNEKARSATTTWYETVSFILNDYIYKTLS
jgi:hypothetical protein